MKLITILIAFIIVAGAGWYLWSNTVNAPEQQNIEQTDDQEATSITDDTTGDDSMGSMEHSTSTDAGMEFPTSDVSATVSTDENARVFNVTGKNFEFDVKEIRVKKGDTVVINFQASEGLHDWTIDEFNAHTAQVGPNTPTSATFVADKVGTFEYYCSIGNHRARGMVGKLIVE